MFGYVRIRKPELKVKDYEIYQGFYCGLCSELKRKYGFLGQVTLTYDMTFLIVLLSSVYDVPVKKSMERCIVHPGKRHLRLSNGVTEYAAHLNMILTYYHFLDDRDDDGSKKAWFGIKAYHKKKEKAAKEYTGLEQRIDEALSELSVLEQRKETDIFQLAGCFGRLMAEIFDYKKDCFSQYLRVLGYHLGRFIYIMDAYDDMVEDGKKGRFNPLLNQRGHPGFEKQVESMLLDEMAAAGEAFQKLPCLEYVDILGNILYAGVWNRYDDIQTEKQKISETLENKVQ